MGVGMAPIPTIEITLGVFKIGIRAAGVNRLNTYPGKSGSSTLFIRSDHRRRLVYSGRKHSHLWYWSSEVTRFSWVLLTWIANQDKPVDSHAFSISQDIIPDELPPKKSQTPVFSLVFSATHIRRCGGAGTPQRHRNGRPVAAPHAEPFRGRRDEEQHPPYCRPWTTARQETPGILRAPSV